MRVFQRSYTRPIPPGAKILRRKDGKVVKYKGHGGEEKEAALSKKAGMMLCKSKEWYIQIYDHYGKKHTFKGFASDVFTRKLASQVQHLLDAAAVKEPISIPVREFFDDLPCGIRDQFVEAGLLDRRSAEEKAVILDELVDKFHEMHVQKEREKKGTESKINFLRRLFDECGFKYWDDLDSDKVMAYLLKKRDGGKGISKGTFNNLVGHAGQFCKWAVEKQKVAKYSPLQQLEKLEKPDTDRRRIRRAADVDDIRHLLKATENGPVRLKMDGPERALVYRFLIETGIRISETRKLTVSCLRGMKQQKPYIRIPANIAKSKKLVDQHITESLAAAISAYILRNGKGPGDRLFCRDRAELPTNFCTDVFRKDLKAAGIAYIDDRGEYLDIHAMRHSYITLFKEAAPHVARSLARHASLDMTQRYTHIQEDDKRQALRFIPDYVGKTGTDD